MKTLTLTRLIFSDTSTIGSLALDGLKVADTLEDTCRREGVKIHGKTAIPPGTYKLAILPSAKYGRLMPRLLNVPGYEGILIHAGNTAQDTAGCILVGRYNEHQADRIYESRKTFDALYERLKAIQEPIQIEVKGGRSFEAVA